MKSITTIVIIILTFGRLLSQPIDNGTNWIVKIKSKENWNNTRKGSDGKIAKVQELFHAANIVDDDEVQSFRITTNGNYGKDEVIKLIGHDLIISLERDHIGYATGSGEVLPNDPFFKRQWYLFNDGSFSIFGLQAEEGADIKILQAWDVSKGSEEIIVAVLDTGVDTDNPDFVNRLWNNDLEIRNNGIDDDGNGYIDDIYGWDFVNQDAQPKDDGGHGNAITGLIGASSNNDNGVAGINQHSRLMICKVLSKDQSGFYSDWAAGIRYAVDNGAHVINMSVAGDRDLKILSDAIQYAADKGVIIVASTGNDNTDQIFYPSGYSSVIAVGSTDPDDNRSLAFNGSSRNGSNYGPHIDVVAPGNAIFALSLFGNDQSTIWGGTSMSCAVVTGVVSLILSAQPDLSTNQLKGLLYKTAQDQVGLSIEDTPGWDQFYGFGRINAGDALNSLVNESPTDPFQLSLFPNPTKDNINITLLLNTTEAASLEVINMQGATSVVRNFKPESPQLNTQVDISTLPSGVYYLRIIQQGFQASRRFVIAK